jgi:UDP-2,3-diacylglucosamine hydrolase
MTTDRRYIVIADAHLGIVEGDVGMMIDFIHTLDPQVDELLFLGDLFHIWAGPEKYHISPVSELLETLGQYQSKDGKTHLVVGNRDIFIPEVSEDSTWSQLPFNTISRDFAFFNPSEKRLAAIHGDTVNSQDRQYLRWRKLVRHPLFQRFFDLMPSTWVKRIMFRLEAGLKNTNQAFRIDFPVNEWAEFVKRVSDTLSPDLLIIGHFHPKKIITLEYGVTKALVIPDWHARQHYLEIESDLSYTLQQFVKN